MRMNWKLGEGVVDGQYWRWGELGSSRVNIKVLGMSWKERGKN